MSESTVGSVSVDVVPSTRGFGRRLRSDLDPEAAKIGQEFGQLFGRAAQSRMADGVKDGLSQGGRDAAASGTRQGSDFGGQFARTVKARLEAAFRSLPEVKIDADSSGADREIASLRARLEELREKRIGVDIDAAAANAEIDHLKADLERLASQSPDIHVRVNSGAAAAELRKVQAEVNRLDGQTAHVNVDADTAAASAQLALMQEGSSGARSSILGIVAAVALLGPALIPIGAAAVGAFGAIASGAIAAVAGIGVLALALGPIIGVLSALKSAHDQSGAAARQSASSQSQVASAIDAVAGAQHGLASATEDAKSAQLRSTQQVADAARTLAEAEHQSSLEQVAATRRVADAKRDLAVAVEQAAVDEIAANRRVEDAMVALGDAETQAALDQARANRRVADARRNLANVNRQAAQSLITADRRVLDADRAVADAQKNATKAQRELADARKQAARDAEDLSSRVANGMLDERSATLAVQEAQQRLAEVRADPSSSQLEVQRAQLAVDQALQGYQDQQTELQRLQQDKADAEKKGVEGSQRVQDAIDQERQAQQRLADAERDAADAAQQAAQARQDAAEQRSQAERDLSDAMDQAAAQQQDSAERIARANRDLADAVDQAGRQQEESARRVSDAQRAVSDAADQNAERQRKAAAAVADAHRGVAAAAQASADQQRHSADAVASAQQAVISAQRGVQQASQSAGAAGGSAMEKYRSKLAELTPEGQNFVKFIKDELLPSFHGLSGIAQKNFLPGLQTALTALKPALPAITGFVGTLAKAFGQLAIEAAKGLASPTFQKFFTYLSGAAGPILISIGRTIGNVAKGFAGLATAFAPVTKQFFSGLEGLSKKFAAFGAGADKNAGFQKFLSYIQENGPKVVAAIGAIAGAGAHIVSALSPLGPIVLSIVTGLARFISAIPPDVILTIAGAIGAVVVGIKAWSVIQAVLNAVMSANPIGLVLIAIAALVAGLILAYRHSETFRNIVQAAWGVIQTVVSFAWNNVLKPVFEAIAGFIVNTLIPAFQTYLVPVIQAVWSGIQAAISVAWVVIQAVFDAIKFYIENVLSPVFSFLWNDVIVPVWHGIAATLGFVWNTLIKPVFEALGSFIKDHVAPVFQTAVDGVKAIWDKFKTALGDIWDKIKAIFKALGSFIKDHVWVPFQAGIDAIADKWDKFKTAVSDIWDKIKAIFSAVGTWIKDNVQKVFEDELTGLKNAWDKLKTAIGTIWEGIKTIFRALGTFIKDHVADKFSEGVKAIQKAWDGVKEVAKTPIRFMIETVVNKGIIDTFNKVAGFFKVPAVPHVPLPDGFATGGFVSGPGGPRDDKIPALLSNGEFVINAAATRQHLELLKAINTGKGIGGDPGGTSIGRFANGGLIERIGKAKQWLPSVDPLPYVWGAVGPNSYDCSGLVGEVWARVTGHPSFRRYFTTSYGDFRGMGFQPGPGMFSMGVIPGVHMAGNAAGLPFEAASTASGIHVGSSAKPVSSFPHVWHLASLPGGSATPKGISITDPIGSLKHLFSGVLDRVHEITGNPFGNLVAAVPHKIADSAIGFVHDAVPGFADGGLVHKYDQGGFLPPGLTTVLNATGKPEPVLTRGQFDNLRSAADGSGEFSGQLVLDSGQFLGVVRGLMNRGQSTTQQMRRNAVLGAIPR